MNHERIFIVEDESIVARDIEGYLLSMGYQIPFIFESGEAVLKTLSQEEHPDLIMMDIMLKGKWDGIDTADQIRQLYDIPVIYLTAYQDDQTLRRARTTEPFGYLMKPFSERELFTTIEMALYKHRIDLELRNSEERYRQLVEMSPDGIIILYDDKIQFINKAGSQILGAGKDMDLIGKNFSQFFEADQLPVFEKSISDIRLGKSNSSLTAQIHSLAGTSLTADIALGYQIHRKHPAIQIVLRDVSEREKIELEKNKLQKLESLGLLAGGIAHDFNNLLTTILGNISLCRVLKIDNPEVIESLAEAEKGCFRAKDLTQQLLAFSKGSTPVRMKQSISEIIRTTAEYSVQGFDTEITFQIPDTIPLLFIDSAQIGQLVQNLVINAREAMGNKGKLDISAEVVSVSPNRIYNNYTKSQQFQPVDFVRVKVEDDGPGIDSQIMNQIFDPYFTTKKNGSGLGLAIAYSIVKKHGGFIEVQSTEGKGSCFTFYLPVLDQGPDRIKEGK